PGGQGVDICAYPANPRRANEDHLDRRRATVEARAAVRLEGLALPAVGVALHADIDEAERKLRRILHIAREENQAGARAEDRPAFGMKLLERGNEARRVHQLEQRGALAPRYDEAVDVPELLGLTYFDRLDLAGAALAAAARERLGVQIEVALEREDADAHYQPRVCMRSFSASWRVPMPTMASPRSSLTRTSTSASLKCVVACTIAFARLAGSEDLKIPEPTNTASAPSCIISAASAGVAMPPAEKFGTGSLPACATQRTRS